MDNPTDVSTPDPFRYVLSYRHGVDGMTVITLLLVRRAEVLMKQIIATVRHDDLRHVLGQCRQHLALRGIEEVNAS